ncbi:MAG: DUF3616 domain-containing protein [Polaromonas sp.]
MSTEISTAVSPSPRSLLQLTLLTLGLAFSAGALTQPAQSPPVIKPDSGPWASGAGFHFDLGKKQLQHMRQSVSGIACNLNAQGQRICLLAFDEGAAVQFAQIGSHTLTPDAQSVVLPSAREELDAESAATDGRYFYVAGSHSARRGDCANTPGSRHLMRFRLDPATGRALRSPADGALVDYADTGRLWPLMQAQPGLAPHVGERKCLGSGPPRKAPQLAGQQGVNIEGMAVKDGQLYFGFRGPVLNDVASVLAVDAEALFTPDAVALPPARLTQLALGQGRGIRDMVAVNNGFLLLAGPDDSAANEGVGWVVAWWDGQSAEGRVVQPTVLATLNLSGVKLRRCDKEIKPEAVTVLDETPAAYRLLVLSDGLCDGGPMTFTVPRVKPAAQR